jgi:hypothetical protein
MTSIYLAKSNRANPDAVSAVRTLLKRFDVDIVEFKGGPYSHKPLLDCEMLIVVPELSDDEYNDDEEYINLGKGLFDQINAFKDENKNCDLLIVNYYHEGTQGLGLGTFDGFECADEDDYINYATLCFKDEGETGTLAQILENRLGFASEIDSTKGSTKRSRYRLLLTSK